MTKTMKEVVQYILLKKNIPDLGATKLAKLLFFIDREYWMLTGKKKFLGVDFKRMNHGPLPDNFYANLKLLEKIHFLRIVHEAFESHKLHKLELINENVDVFQLEDAIGKQGVDVINYVLKRDGQYSASVLEDITHDKVWENTPHGAILKYEDFPTMRWDYFKDKSESDLSEKQIERAEKKFLEFEELKKNGLLKLKEFEIESI